MRVGLLLLAIQAVAALNTATLLRPRARIFLQLAEDYDFFEEEENEGLSVTTRATLCSLPAARSRPTLPTSSRIGRRRRPSPRPTARGIFASRSG